VIRSSGEVSIGRVISNSKSGHLNRINLSPFFCSRAVFGRWVPWSVGSGSVPSGILNGLFWVRNGWLIVIVSDNQVTVACATLGKFCQISLLPLRTEQHDNIIRDQYNQPSELHFDEPKNACTIRDRLFTFLLISGFWRSYPCMLRP
jgi:hypothetical protein